MTIYYHGNATAQNPSMFGAVFAVGRKSHERRDGTWNFRDYQSPDQEMKVDAIGVAIPLLRIYDRVSILPATN